MLKHEWQINVFEFPSVDCAVAFSELHSPSQWIAQPHHHPQASKESTQAKKHGKVKVASSQGIHPLSRESRIPFRLALHCCYDSFEGYPEILYFSLST